MPRNLTQRALDVGVAVNDVTPIDDDGRDLRDAGAPGIGDTLIGIRKRVLKSDTPAAHALLYESRCACGFGGERA